MENLVSFGQLSQKIFIRFPSEVQELKIMFQFQMESLMNQKIQQG